MIWQFLIAWVVGICLCQQLVQLPNPQWPVYLLTLTAGSMLGSWHYVFSRGIVASRAATLVSRTILVITALLCGFSWAVFRADLRLNDQLALDREGQDLVLHGYVADLPKFSAGSTRFEFVLQDRPPGVPERLVVSWYQARQGWGRAATPIPGATLPDVRAGEAWQLKLRLRRSHGSLNPHSFDYEAWQFERGVRAQGQVRDSPENRRLEAVATGFAPFVQNLRERVRTRFEKALPDAPWRGVLSALAVGDQGAISSQQWTLFSALGLTHLISISGLHVTLIAAMLAWVVNAFWRRVPALCLRLPAPRAAALMAAVSAFAYVVLAGFGVPAQRTLYMLLVVCAAVFFGRGAALWWSLALALWFVLLIDPWAVMAAGFWLSFGAVASLMLVGRAAIEGGGVRAYWVGFGRTQWAITILSLPILLSLFQQFSLVSPLANILAIPVVGLVVTPLALLFAVLPLPVFASLAHTILAVLMQVLTPLSELSMANWQQAAPPFWMTLLAVVAALWALMPRGVPGRWVGLLALLPMLSYSPPRPTEGQLDMRVVDVGQGLAVHIQTATQDIVFDAGANFGPDSDSGERIVVPLLRALGVKSLTGVVVSHDDNDHSGGAASVLSATPASWLAHSLPSHHALVSNHPKPIACRAGQAWTVDGVQFKFVHPRDPLLPRDNDQSCVLHVQSPYGAALIPGDIESAGEREIVAAAPEAIRADVLVAPHHGSKTSSSEAFIAAVSPQHVVFTMGYRNRFGHPHPKVVDRYTDRSVTQWRSDQDGGILFRFNADGLSVVAERQTGRRYWHGQ